MVRRLRRSVGLGMVVAMVSGKFSSMDAESGCRVILQKQKNAQIFDRASLNGGNIEQ